MPKNSSSLGSEESKLTGSRLELPLVHGVAAIRSQSASRISWHRHPCYELILLLDGSTAYEFSDGLKVDLPGGHFMLIPPGVEHRGFDDIRRPVRLTGIMFDPKEKFATRNTPFTLSGLDWLKKQFDSNAPQASRMGTELRSHMKTLPQDFASLDLDDIPVLVSIRLKLCSILFEAARQITLFRTFEPKHTVQSAISYMENHLAETATIEEIAEHVQCSRARLFQLFKDGTGLAPNDYWQRLRIDHAQELLTKSKRSITEIAMDCGFTTSQYFSRVFRRYCNLTPSEYRTLESNGTEI